MAFYCAHIKEENKSEWENLVAKSSSGGFMQSFAWAKFKQYEKWDLYKIGLFSSETNTLVGGAVVIQFKFSNNTNFLYIPQGPILNFKNEEELFWQWRTLEPAIKSIVNISKTSKTTHLRIEPRIEKVPKWFLNGFEKAHVNLQPKFTQIISLTLSEKAILAQMKQKGRYNINLANKKGISVVGKKLSTEDINIFYELYSQTYKRDKFTGKSKKFFESFAKAYENLAYIYFAKYKDEILSSAIVIHFGDIATYLYGASSNSKREYMAPYAMHWHIMKEARQKGYKEYDLWGVNRDIEDKSHPWHGITRFKKQFGGTQLNLIGSYDYIFQKDLYKEFLKKHES